MCEQKLFQRYMDTFLVTIMREKINLSPPPHFFKILFLKSNDVVSKQVWTWIVSNNDYCGSGGCIHFLFTFGQKLWIVFLIWP